MQASTSELLQVVRLRTPRFKVAWDIEADYGDGRANGRILNISVTGFLIWLPSEFAAGDRIDVEFTMPSGDIMHSGVKIVRCTTDESGGFRLGATFVSMTEADCARLSEHLYATGYELSHSANSKV